jgi:hypothetical protein
VTPFLLEAFVILYLLPDRTGDLFAWPIAPSLTSRVLASAYLCGAFFLRVLREQHWHVVGNGFLSVLAFASLLGIATVLHWDKFTHDHVSFWTWSALYFGAPFLVLAVWLANRRYAAPVAPGDPLLGTATRVTIVAVGLFGAVLGIAMFLAPDAFVPHWPWPLTPLTARVVAAVLCLAGAGVGSWRDPRWTAASRMLEVTVIMAALMLVGTALGHAELDTGSPLFWPWLLGLVGLLVGSAATLLRHRLGVQPSPQPEAPGL